MTKKDKLIFLISQLRIAQGHIENKLVESCEEVIELDNAINKLQDEILSIDEEPILPKEIIKFKHCISGYFLEQTIVLYIGKCPWCSANLERSENPYTKCPKCGFPIKE